MTKEALGSDFFDWWRQLNAELGKLHKGQQALFKDAREQYHAGWSPTIAAEKLMAEWSVGHD